MEDFQVRKLLVYQRVSKMLMIRDQHTFLLLWLLWSLKIAHSSAGQTLASGRIEYIDVSKERRQPHLVEIIR